MINIKNNYSSSIIFGVVFFWQVCVSFQLHRGVVVIPKTTNPDRVLENLKSTDLDLNAEEMRRLREVDRNVRLLTGKFMFKEGQTQDEFWDVEEDNAYEVKEPEAKKSKTVEE